MTLFGLPLPMKQSTFVIMTMATIATAADILPDLVTRSLNTVMAQGQNVTGGNATTGNMTETESPPSAGETGYSVNNPVLP
jgi:hypothetical protein